MKPVFTLCTCVRRRWDKIVFLWMAVYKVEKLLICSLLHLKDESVWP